MNQSGLHWVSFRAAKCWLNWSFTKIRFATTESKHSTKSREKETTFRVCPSGVCECGAKSAEYSFNQLCFTRCTWTPVCTAALMTVFLPPQRNMWRVTLAAPQRPSCRRTLASISCSVKRATPAAPSPASRPASRLWRARGRSSAQKPTKDHRNWAPPPPSASPFPSQKGRSWGWTPAWFAKRTLWIELREGLAVV